MRLMSSKVERPLSFLKLRLNAGSWRPLAPSVFSFVKRILKRSSLVTAAYRKKIVEVGVIVCGGNMDKAR